MDLDELEWPAEHPQLGQLEQSLRCKICHDLFTGPVTLPCGHSYCSQCIRSNFDFKIRENHKVACPECRTQLDPADLRPSLALRDACALFSTCKPLLLQGVQLLSLQQAEPGQPQQQKGPQQQQHMRAQRPQPGRRLTRRLSSELQQQQQQQQQQPPGSGDTRDEAGPSCSRPHSDPLTGRQTRTQRSTRTQPRASSSPPGMLAAAAVDHSDEEEEEAMTVSGSQESGEDGSDADSEYALSPAAKRRKTGDRSGKENVAAPQQQQELAANGGRQQQGRLSNSSSDEDAEEAAAAARPAKRAQVDYTECPVCGITVHIKFIQTHVNDCLTKQQASADDDFAAPRGMRGSGGRGSAQRASAPAALAATQNGRQPAAVHGRAVKACPLPPKLCFNMMSSKEVKDRLLALGLPVDLKPKMTKEAMVARYQAFRTFVQALPDSGRVLTQEQAVAEFSVKERQRHKAGAKQQLMAPAAAAGGAAAGNSSFDELIKQTRARQQDAAPKQQQQHQQQQQQQQQPTSRPHADLSTNAPGHEAADFNDEFGEEGLSQPQQDEEHGWAPQAAAPGAGTVAFGGAARLSEWPSEQQQQQQWHAAGMQSCAYQQVVAGAQQQQARQQGQPIVIDDSDMDE